MVVSKREYVDRTCILLGTISEILVTIGQQ
jgi:hypothetical protein